MPSKRCYFCGKLKHMDELTLCCAKCEEVELDLLMATYAYIHCSNMEYCPTKDLINTVDPIQGKRVTITLIRSWSKKQWLEKNIFEAIKVPEPIKEDLEENGFCITRVLREKLHKQQNKKPIYVPKEFDKQSNQFMSDNKRQQGMVFIEKMKKNTKS